MTRRDRILNALVALALIALGLALLRDRNLLKTWWDTFSGYMGHIGWWLP
jgi:hypothetical protein